MTAALPRIARKKSLILGQFALKIHTFRGWRVCGNPGILGCFNPHFLIFPIFFTEGNPNKARFSQTVPTGGTVCGIT